MLWHFCRLETISEIDNRAFAVVPDAHIALVTGLDRNGGRLQTRGKQAGSTENREHADKSDRERRGEQGDYRQNCNAGCGDEKRTYALHDPNLSIQTNVGLLLPACKRIQWIVSLQMSQKLDTSAAWSIFPKIFL
ncbi:hypothetical protein AGR7C_Cc10103 [Agrobacterium deltaense Zutra 3/1]|uniref:Uncharacterized protein n=1 Tax=Agrobacterium deltaense Zutra 3/1 TaxID=1183427 RepID=A0A1S7NS99_9HYPH|nr:hypothetical protein AGR7C_Cc10103 [Agrobacterium deltaense Zutra 3/1]